MKSMKKPGLLLAAATASLAVAGVGAGTANATLLTACTGSNITGQGSSLQRAAQSIWNPSFNTNAAGCAVAPNTPTASYTVNSSGTALKAWHSDGTTTFSTSQHFGGTDDAPDATQIANINASVASGGSGSSVLSIPVAQAAIAIVVNPPSGCSISQVTAANLEAALRGASTTWSAIGGSGASCSTTINRVVRADSSGTTYQLKHYLFTVNGAAVSGTNTWADLQAASLNTTWPGTTIASKAGGTGAAGSGSGGGDEVKTVGNTASSIGYAALSDARANYNTTTFPNLKWIAVRGAGQSLAVNPSTNGVSTTKANSSCPSLNSAYGASLPAATASWSGVYETTPGSAYAICTLTWDLALADYTPKWGTTTGRSVATTVHDYLGYVVATSGGQADALASTNDYAALPADVQSAAISGVSQIVD